MPRIDQVCLLQYLNAYMSIEYRSNEEKNKYSVNSRSTLIVTNRKFQLILIIINLNLEFNCCFIGLSNWGDFYYKKKLRNTM